MADATSLTYIKRAKRVDSTDLPLELEVQLPEPYFKGKMYDTFGNRLELQQELLSDGLFDTPESFIPAFDSHKTEFQEDSLANNSMTLSSGFNEEFLTTKKQESCEFEMVRHSRQYGEYNNVGGRSILFPLAIVFCVMCFASTGNFLTSSLFQPVSEIVSKPRGPIGDKMKHGSLMVEFNQVDSEIMDDDL